MSKELLISSTSLETKLAILEDGEVTEIFIERTRNRGILGNIYKGKVTRVLPGMQAAFVNIGLERDAFLYVTDFSDDYEEYEALFEGEEAYGAMRPLGDSKKSTQPGGSGIRGGRHDLESPPAIKSSKKTVHSGSVSSKSAGEDVEDSTNPSLQTLPLWGREASEESRRILPQNYGTSLRASGKPPDPKDQAWPGILSDRLETLVEFAPPEKGDKELPDRDVRLEEKSDLQKLSIRQESRRGKRNSSGRRNGRILIGDLLREGQEILVQVAKEPIGKKGARITSHVVFPGRYLVFMPTVTHVGVSRKISSEKERNRLKEVVENLRGENGKGFIVRTVAENHDEADFGKDMAYLTKLWDDVRKKADKFSAPALVHAEPKLIFRVVRDYFSGEYRAIRVDDEQEYEWIMEFVSRFNPDWVKHVRLYNKKVPLFDEYGVNVEIEKALRQKVWLKNGGYIVINQTEALVAIDINTGKFVGKTNSLEDTVTKTNLGAVKEVVRQIRLRNLGGIIVIDFIDMDERKNQLKVLEALQREFAKDKSPSKILQFNEFGLVAITRRRVKQSLEKTLCQPCYVCSGTGLTKSVRSVCYTIHEEVRRMVSFLQDDAEILVRCHPQVCEAFRNAERQVLKEIEDLTGKAVSLKVDSDMHIEQFDVVET